MFSGNGGRHRNSQPKRIGFSRVRSSSGVCLISYSWFWRNLQDSAERAGVGKLGTHAFQHTCRSWLDAVGTPIAVQQKMMRHTDIRTTLNIYGDVVTNEMAEASSKVAGLALNGLQY